MDMGLGGLTPKRHCRIRIGQPGDLPGQRRGDMIQGGL